MSRRPPRPPRSAKHANKPNNGWRSVRAENVQPGTFVRKPDETVDQAILVVSLITDDRYAYLYNGTGREVITRRTRMLLVRP